MKSTPQTSASYSQTAPSISSAYQRIGGATPIISSESPGPQIKSLKDSLMERERAKREVDEELNPWKKTFREQNEYITNLLLGAQKQGMQRDEELMKRMTSKYGNTPEAAGAFLAEKQRRDLDYQKKEMAAQKGPYKF